MHDGLLDRTTTGTGRVEELSSAYIRAEKAQGMQAASHPLRWTESAAQKT